MAVQAAERLIYHITDVENLPAILTDGGLFSDAIMSQRRPTLIGHNLEWPDMIDLANGNLLAAPAEALVNTVNTAGVMGRGIALQFKQAYPGMFRAYEAACRAGDVAIGKMHVFDRGGLTGGPRWIINFPTKRHWRTASRITDVEAGLGDLVATVQRLGIRSVAIPPLDGSLGAPPAPRPRRSGASEVASGDAGSGGACSRGR